MVKIDVNGIIDDLFNISLNFGYFKISGRAEINARLLFRAMVEFERYSRRPYDEVYATLYPSQKKEIMDMVNEVARNKTAETPAEQEEIKREQQAIALAYINRHIINNDMLTIEAMEAKIVNDFSQNRLTNVSNLFSNILKEMKINKTIEFDFLDDDILSRSGLAVINKEKAEALHREIMGINDLNEIAELTFSYYKKGFKFIYDGLIMSITDFFENVK